MKKLATLLLLYFAQGLPFGFQATALPIVLRSRGVSLQAISAVGLLATPWLVKALWAPWVDRYGFAGFGRRKSWIVPMQAGLCLCAFTAARSEQPALLLALVFLMNLFAATQDIAVDGLAVGSLASNELGIGNSFQVVGYKLGMLTGGGLLLWASERIGFSGLFDAMGVLMLLVMLVALTIDEPTSQSAAREAEPQRLIDVLRALRSAFRDSAALPLLGVVLTYKCGESLANAMWKPMLFDYGFSASQVGLWTGTYGMLASLLGSFGAGLWVRSRSLAHALLATAVLRALGVAGEWWVSAAASHSAAQVIVVTCLEHLLGGAITTVMFALMMRHTRREISGTHYTVLASLEVLGKMPFGALSGVLAQRVGYPPVFALGTGLCVAFALGVWLTRQRFELRVRESVGA